MRSANRAGIPSPSCSVRIFCMSTMYHFGTNLTSGPGVEEQFFREPPRLVRKWGHNTFSLEMLLKVSTSPLAEREKWDEKMV